jgi:hypothetical protein
MMHIDTPYKVTMSYKATGSTEPISAFGFRFVTASGTLARCSSFGAREARDAGLFGFVGQVVDIFAIFPQGHALIVVSATVTIAHSLGIADEERPDLIRHAKVNHLTGRFVTQITDTSFTTRTHLVPGMVQFLPTAGILLATALLPGKVSQLPATLSLEGTDPTSRDDHAFPRVGGDCRQMNFSQVNRCLDRPRSLLRL